MEDLQLVVPCCDVNLRFVEQPAILHVSCDHQCVAYGENTVYSAQLHEGMRGRSAPSFTKFAA